jgi:hypothetical protein
LGGSGRVGQVPDAGLAAAKAGGSRRAASPSRFQAPLERTTSEVRVQTTRVSMKGSRPATTPSRTGSVVLAAQWAIGELPWPASLENRARFMPHRKA